MNWIIFTVFTPVFLFLQEIGSLREIIEARKTLLFKFGHTLQPVVVLVGPASNIRQSLVVLDKQRWECGSPLLALDACFKVIFALNSLYPAEARHMWLLIQRCVYELETDFDFKNDAGLKSYVSSYIGDCKNFLKSLVL